MARALRSSSARAGNGASGSSVSSDARNQRMAARRQAERERRLAEKMAAGRLEPLTESLDAGCVICQANSLEVGEEVVKLECGHHYHEECIQPWLSRMSNTCPVCRKEIL